MRSTFFAAVVVGTLAFASAQECAEFNTTTDPAAVTPECGGFLGSNAAVDLATLKCDTAETAQSWAAQFEACVDGLGSSYDVHAADQTTLCSCYKKFVQFGFTNGCQKPEIIQALAIQGFRFGVGEPFFSKFALASAGTCTLTGLDTTTGIYSGAGNLLTAPVSDAPVFGVKQSCIPACASICPYDDCAPAAGVTIGGAALAMVFAAVASLMQ